ncbi:ROK family transcriptional regulator [Actinokineospora soli]
MLDAASPWAPLLPSARRVTLEVLLHGPLARSELADRLGLSTASLTRLTKPLMDAGLLREVETPNPRGGGRPLQPLDVDPDVQRFIGSATAEITDQSPEAVVARIAELVAELDDGARPVAAIGIGIGGVVRGFSRVQRAVFLHWGEIDLGAAVTAATGRPTVVSNDVDALLEAEHWFGDGRDVQSFAVLTIGAGVGGGLVVHDHLVSGPDSGLGLLGHFPVDPLGPACPEGHRGCVKALLTTDAIQSQAALTLGKPVTYDEVLDLAEAGNAVADQIVGRAAHAFGTLIAAVANIAQPERIILTGEGIRLAQVAEARVRAAIAQSRHAEASPIDLRFISDDPTLWARGAAAVAIQRTVLVALPPRTT